jgi:hypothetical protein
MSDKFIEHLKKTGDFLEAFAIDLQPHQVSLLEKILKSEDLTFDLTPRRGYTYGQKRFAADLYARYKALQMVDEGILLVNGEDVVLEPLMHEDIYDQIQGDPVAAHWMTEILLNSDLEANELLLQVAFIQRNGYGKHLAATNSVRIPLARIAEVNGVPLTDGSKIKRESVST